MAAKKKTASAPADLAVLVRFGWSKLDGLGDEYRHACEVIHALAYGLVSDDPALVRKLKNVAVALMRGRRVHVGATWNARANRYDYGPDGVVCGGPVYDSHTTTQEIDAMAARVRRSVTPARGGADPLELEACAFRVAMGVIADVCTEAPSVYFRVPGSNGRQPHAHVLANKGPAVAAAKAVLENEELPDWPTPRVVLAVIGAVLRALGIPPADVKDAIDNVKKRGVRKRRGQKR